MARRILIFVVVVAVCIGIYYWYAQRSDSARMADGNVYSTDSSSNLDLDGHPQVRPTPSRSDAPGTVNTAPVASGSTSTSGSQSSSPSKATAVPATSPTAAATNSTPSGIGPVPVSDTIAPNPPNGLAFGGTGKYQWYRQGNLTWRVDTSSGSSCIAFATMDEWRKPIVYTHGCGNA